MLPETSRPVGRYATVESPVVDVSPSSGPFEEEDARIIYSTLPRFGDSLTVCSQRALSFLTLGLSICVLIMAGYIHKQKQSMELLMSSDFSGSNSNSLKWLPLPAEATVLTRIAFGSCARQDMPQPYWDTLSVLFQPQLVLLMGDNVYGDCDDDACTKLQKAYDDFGAHPSVQGAARKFPVFPTLDDHDYGQGDCHRDNPYKEIARQKFADFYDIDMDDLPKDGVYRYRSFGTPGKQLQIILLDTRYGRSPFLETNNKTEPFIPATDDMEQQMLSERQWAWLEGVLDEEADLRVIVSSIQVLSDGCVFEAWRHLPKERGRLYDMIRDKNAILVSGDRHVGAFLESDDGSLREVTASSWTHTIPFGAYGSNCSSSEECDEVDSRRVGHFVRVNHFGSLEIDWEKREYMVALRKAETSYGTMYHHNWDSDAGMVIRSVNYTF